MAGPVKLGEFIAEYQQTLQLQFVAGEPDPELRPRADSGFWIGPYDGSCRPLIEVIGPDKLADFTEQLHAQHHDNQYGEFRDTSRILIFSDGIDCSGSLLEALPRRNISVYHSARPAKLIVGNLANALVQQGPYRSYHGVALRVFGQGILLTGASGVGKSGTTLELLSRGHTLVADDLPTLARLPNSRQVFAVCPMMLADLLEVRALGILDVNKLFGDAASAAICQLKLVIELVAEYTPDAEIRLSPYRQSSNILDVDFPRLRLPVQHVTNPAVLVETLVKNHVLYNAGDDAGMKLIMRQRKLLEERTL